MIIKYLIYDSDCCEYKAKTKNVKKLVGVTYNYCGSLYEIITENNQERCKCIYYSGEDIEFNREMLKDYGIDIKEAYIGSSLCNVPFYKDENLFEKYNNIRIEEVGREIKYR